MNYNAPAGPDFGNISKPVVAEFIPLAGNYINVYRLTTGDEFSACPGMLKMETKEDWQGIDIVRTTYVPAAFSEDGELEDARGCGYEYTTTREQYVKDRNAAVGEERF